MLPLCVLFSRFFSRVLNFLLQRASRSSKMPRKYVRKFSNIRNGKTFKPYRMYTNESLQRALQLYRKGQLKLDDVEAKHGIPRSTFARLAKKGVSSLPTYGPSPLFSI